MLNQGIFKILFYVLLSSYVEIILKDMMPIVSPHPAVGSWVHNLDRFLACNNLAKIDNLEKYSEI